MLEPLTSAQVETVNTMEPADALSIAHALNEQLVFFVGASGVQPPVFAGDVLELCKADAGFRAGPLKERCDFELPLDLEAGTSFQQAVWRALLQIPAGGTTSYGALGQCLGKPQASRAVGAAVGRNPVSVVVPCHRVLGTGGALTGYAGGLERKSALLRLEGALM